MLFGPAAITGILAVQYAVATIHHRNGHAYWELENATLSASGLFFTICAVAGHLSGVYASYLFILAAGSLAVALFVNDGFFAENPWKVSYATYFVAALVPSAVGSEGFMGFLEIFVPLGGRSGHDAPFDIIVSSIVGGLTFLSAPWILAFAHRFGRGALLRLIVFCGAVSFISIAVFLNVSPFDADHPKRMLALHMTNISTTPPNFSLHVAGIDGGPGFTELVSQTADAVSIDSSKLERNVMYVGHALVARSSS